MLCFKIEHSGLTQIFMANGVPVSMSVFQKELTDVVAHFRRNSMFDSRIELEFGLQARLFVKTFRYFPPIDRRFAEKRVNEIAVFLVIGVVKRNRVALVLV